MTESPVPQRAEEAPAEEDVEILGVLVDPGNDEETLELPYDDNSVQDSDEGLEELEERYEA